MLSVSQFEDKNVVSEAETNELVLDGGFPLPKQVSQNLFISPDINSFGHTFRLQFNFIITFIYLILLYMVFHYYLYIYSFGTIFCRNYDAESERQKSVEEFYRLQHINQTYDFVSILIIFNF